MSFVPSYTLEPCLSITLITMNNTVFGGLIIGALVVVGGIGLIAYTYGGSAGSPTASTTPDGSLAPVSVVPTATAAPSVTTNTLVVVSGTAAVVTGSVVPNGAQTSYWYEYGRTDAFGTRSTTQYAGSGFVRIATPAFISNLSPNTQYSTRLMAMNAYGTTAGQIYRFTTNTTVQSVSATLPIIRTDLSSSLTSTSASVNGQVNPNGSETIYWFEYGNTDALGNTTTSISVGGGMTAKNISMLLSGLKPLTTYYYRLDSQNQYGTVNGSILSFITTGTTSLNAPLVSTLAPTAIASSTVTLHGQINPNGNSATYWFQYGTVSTKSNTVDSSTGTIVGNTDRIAVTGNTLVPVVAQVIGLKSLTKYYYQLMVSTNAGTVSGAMVTFTTTKSLPSFY